MAAEEDYVGKDVGLFGGNFEGFLSEVGGAFSMARETIAERFETVDSFIANAYTPAYVLALIHQDSKGVYGRFLRNCYAILRPDSPLLDIPAELKEIAESAYKFEDGENLVDALIRLRRLIEPLSRSKEPQGIDLLNLSLQLYKSLIELYEMKQLRRVPASSLSPRNNLRVRDLHAQFIELYVSNKFDISTKSAKSARMLSFFNGAINISNAMAQALKENEDKQLDRFIERVQGVDPLKWRKDFEESLIETGKSVTINEASEKKLREVLEQFNQFMQAQERIKASQERRVEVEIKNLDDEGMQIFGGREKHRLSPGSVAMPFFPTISGVAGGSSFVSPSFSSPHVDSSAGHAAMTVSSFGVPRPHSTDTSVLVSEFNQRGVEAGHSVSPDPKGASPFSPSSACGTDLGRGEDSSSPSSNFMLQFLINSRNWIRLNPKKAIAIGVVACLAVAIGISIATCGAGAVLAGLTAGGLAIAGHPITTVITGLAIAAPAVVAGIMWGSGFFDGCSSKEAKKVSFYPDNLTLTH